MSPVLEASRSSASYSSWCLCLGPLEALERPGLLELFELPWADEARLDPLEELLGDLVVPGDPMNATVAVHDSCEYLFRNRFNNSM